MAGVFTGDALIRLESQIKLTKKVATTQKDPMITLLFSKL